MSTHGPRPEPTVLKVLRGNPGCRRINGSEPQPPSIVPEPPGSISGNPRAIEEWNRLVPMLQQMRLLTAADYLALANICYDVAVLEETRAALDKDGLTFINPKTGMEHQSPLLNVLAVTTDRLLRHLREFGLTVSSRSTLKMQPNEDQESAGVLNGEWRAS